VDEALVGRGLTHYEISNFAAPGEEARHNLGYWRGDPYLGLGCGAVGALEEDHGAFATRYRNTTSPEAYMKLHGGDGAAADPAIGEEVERLSPETRLKERIMLGLRLAEGFDLAAAAAPLGVEPFTRDRERALRDLQNRGRIAREGSVLRIPREAWLFTDDTAARLF
jgi:oxygen-independent coproporphyrinogen-3 oxidase